jgi:bifunctional oligoribonuclease and PAP phosphatase NrnA
VHGTGAPLGRYSHEVPPDAREAARAVGEVLARAKRVLILGHAGADGDVCGSSLGLACALRERGVTVDVYNAEPYPEAYAWLPGGESVRNELGPDETWDTTVVVDAARPDRLGAHFPGAARRGTFVWIDHHRIPDVPGDVGYVDLTAAAVGEQVAQILDAMGQAISVEVASCLYASLLADTGGFRYGNTSARAFRLAARLVETGVDPWQMTERIYESQDEAKLRLMGRALSSLWVSPCGRLGVVEVTAHDVNALGAREEHVQGIVNHVRGVKGVEVAVLLRETHEGTKVIVRSRGNVSVAPVAQQLGVIGHKNAASFHLERPLRDARAVVVDTFLASMPRVQPAKPRRVRAKRQARPAE